MKKKYATGIWMLYEAALAYKQALPIYSYCRYRSNSFHFAVLCWAWSVDLQEHVCWTADWGKTEGDYTQKRAVGHQQEAKRGSEIPDNSQMASSLRVNPFTLHVVIWFVHDITTIDEWLYAAFIDIFASTVAQRATWRGTHGKSQRE